MIETINGNIAALNPVAVVLDTPGGVGYLLNITLPTFTTLQSQKQARLLVHEVIREDTYTLYGFLDERERELFRLLIGVSGIGANTARLILSALPAAELESVIAGGDDRRLKAVKGIGLKTAQRIIVDLKDKIKTAGSPAATAATASSREAYEEALAALVILGFPKAASQKTLDKVFAAEPDISAEAAIKRAMPQM